MVQGASTPYDPGMDDNAGTCYLTDRQKEVHNYIRTYFRQFREAPTRQQIQHAMGFKSPNAAQYYVEVLAKKGALAWEPGKFRGIVPQSAPQPDSDVRFALHY
jgi:SOS-response transcriptional repressor LexA